MKSPLPQVLTDRLIKQFGASTVEALIKAFKSERLTTVRVNTLKTTEEAVMARFREEAIAFERVKGLPGALFIKNRGDREMLEHPLTVDGHLYLQGLASMLPPLVLDPKPGEKVLDLCAAPGSKTSQLAAMMGVGGELIAWEKDAIRIQKLRNTLKIQGADFVKAEEVDSTLQNPDYFEYFDAILADVPCSAEGRIDFSVPASYKYWSQKNILEHAKLQRRLMRNAARMIKVGGRIIYSTCTLAPEENEDLISWFLTEHPNFKLEKIVLPLSPTRPAGGGLVLLPTDKWEGFFVAKLIRKA